MKFLCDVHISYKFVSLLKNNGFEAIHVNEILNKSETKDNEICNYADKFDFVVITKDADFRDTFFINNSPKKLIKINLGNISNNLLINIFQNNIGFIKSMNNKESFLLEIETDEIFIFER